MYHFLVVFLMVSILLNSITATRARIETSIPRKHGPAIAGYETALKKFFEHVLQVSYSHEVMQM